MNKYIGLFVLFIIVLFMNISVISASDLCEDLEQDNSITTNEISCMDTSYNINTYSNSPIEEKETTVLENNSEVTSEDTDANNRIILNSSTFNDYVSDGQFNDKVHNGDVIDVQGLLDSPFFNLTVNKAVNITSSTHDACWGSDYDLSFRISKEGSGTNVSDINFFKTRISVSNTTDVSLDNITNIMTNYEGSGSINNVEGLSENIRITNSYFYSEQIGTWSCNFKVSGVNGLLVENCTFIEVGFCMNNVYLQIAYNIAEEHKVNNNITLRNCIIDGSDAVSQAASCGLVMQGSNILVENCSITHNSTRTYAGENYIVMGVWIDLNWGTGNEGEDIATDLVSSLIFRNNVIEGDHIEGGDVIFSAFNGAKVYNNTLINVTSWVGNQEVYNNTFEDLKIVKNNTILSDNLIKGYLNVSNNNIINNNIILGKTYIEGLNNTFADNYCSELTVKNESANVIKDNSEVIVVDEKSPHVQIVDNTAIIAGIVSDSTVYINLKNSDVGIIDITSQLENVNITVLDTDYYHVKVNPESSGVSFVNCHCPYTSFEIENNHTFINSDILKDVYSVGGIYLNTTLMADVNNYTTFSLDSSLDKDNSYEDFFDENGYLKDDFSADSNLLIRNTPLSNSNSSYTKSVIINKRINITALNGTFWNADINFVKGSEGSTISNLIVNNINVYTDNITVENNTVLKNIKLVNANANTLSYNIFESDSYLVVINSSYNLIYKNKINTSADYAVQFDKLSVGNAVTKNILISKDLRNKYSIKSENDENSIYDNYPRLNSNLTILMSNTTVINDTEIELNISVVYEKEPVRGNLVITVNGVPIENSTVFNNNYITVIKFDKELGKKSIRSYFYPEDVYDNKVAEKNVTVTKIKNNIELSYNEVKLCEDTVITAKVTDEMGENIQEGFITFTLNDINITKEIRNGSAQITASTREEYNGQSLTAYYAETSKIFNNTAKVSFKSLKGDADLLLSYEINDNITTVRASVKNKFNESITKGFIQFSGPSISKIVKVESDETSITINTPAEDTTITATFRNNPNYENTNSNITIITHKNTKITLNSINTKYNTKTIISGILTDENDVKLSNQTVRLIIEDKESNVICSDGKFEYETVFKNTGQQTVTAIFDGNDRYLISQTETIANIEKQDVIVSIDKISEANAGTNVTITGRFTDINDKAISKSNVRIFINGVKYYAKTDSNGVYNFSVLVTKVGLNNLTVGYGGNINYNEYNADATFSVGKQDVIVTVDEISEVGAGNNVTITGIFIDNLGKAITNSNVRLYVNGVKYFARTDKTGKFTLSVLVTKVGVNNLTYGYAGNAKYNEYNANTTFKVGKQDVIVTVDEIVEVNAGNNVTITGKFTDNLGKALSNSNVRLYVNGVKYFARTDKNGVYILSVLVTKVGTNNLTYGYAGSAKYNEYNADTTFSVGKQDVIVTIDEIMEVKAGTNTTITGTFTDNLGKAITNSVVRLYVNGAKYLARTDKTGKFTLSVLVTKVGVNNLTYGYGGSAKYNEFNADTTFSVGKQDVTVTYSKISDVKLGQNVTITGKFTDNLGKAITNSNVRIIFNGVKSFARTDKTGTYTFTTTPNKEGTYNITVGYGGNTKYNAYETSTTFKVTNN